MLRRLPAPLLDLIEAGAILAAFCLEVGKDSIALGPPYLGKGDGIDA